MSIQNAITGLVSTSVGASIAKNIKAEKQATLAKKQKEEYGKALEKLPEVEKDLASSKSTVEETNKELKKLKSIEGKVSAESRNDFNELIKQAKFANKIARQEVKARVFQRKQLRETISAYKKGGNK